MIEHRYLSEVSGALHIFRDFSILVCAVLTFIRIAVGVQAAHAPAKTQRVQRRPQSQSGI
jgi:hypothetical protein